MSKRLARLPLPDDYHVGLCVFWRRGARLMTGYVKKVRRDKDRPALVRSNGRDYKPHIDFYCDENGESVSHFTIPHQTGTSRERAARLRALMKSTPPWGMGASHVAELRHGVFAVGSLMGSCNEYDPPTPWYVRLAGYEVRQGKDQKWGIYTREYNCRVATFNAGAHQLREVLRAACDEAHRLESKPSIGHEGWYTHGCGQWVHDKRAPCTVCKPKRKHK